MKNALLALVVVPFLTMPALAGSLSGGEMIVAEEVGVQVGPVGVGVGERHRHRDHRDHRDRHRHHHDDDRR